jgi:hypothetical protein
MAAAGSAFAQSHPAYWNLASPESTSVVGIRWPAVRQSVLGQAVEAQLGVRDGGLGLPEVGLLESAQTLFLAGPRPIAVVTGKFNWPKIQAAAGRKGFLDDVYRGVPILGSPKRGQWSIARLDDQTVLAGDRDAIRAALDRANYETGSATPPASKGLPLLLRGAALAQKFDFWVIAKEYPDELAGEFIALEDFGGITSVEGGVSFQNGLSLDAVLMSATESEAKKIAANLKDAIPALPAIAQSLRVTASGTNVKVTLAVNSSELSSQTRRDAEPLRQGAATEITKVDPPPPPQPRKPAVIRVYGLDEGVKEIVLKKPAEQQQ